MTEQQVQQRSQTPVIHQYLTRHKDQISAALPQHVSADRMARIALTEVRKTPKLLDCNPQSLFGAIIQCSQLGLEPGNALGHAYLLPFRNKQQGTTDVQLIIGYKGMLALARNSGQINSITARDVYEQDQFHYEFGLHEDLKHVPSEDADRGDLTHVYAVAHLAGGGVQWDVMTRSEVEAIRKQSKSGDSGPWKTHFPEMAKKSVIRRLFKYLPVSVEIQKAAGLDEMADAGVSQSNAAVIDGEWTPGPLDPEPESKTDSVKQRLQSQSAEETSDVSN